MYVFKNVPEECQCSFARGRCKTRFAGQVCPQMEFCNSLVKAFLGFVHLAEGIATPFWEKFAWQGQQSPFLTIKTGAGFPAAS